MGNQLKWKVDVDGEVYNVECVTMKTLYEIYVDGELAIRAPRQMKHTSENSEYDLRIGSKRCQFVVYDGVPDLCVDGILLGAERLLEHQERRNRWLKIFGGMALILVNTYAIFTWIAFQIAGEPVFGGAIALVLFFLLIGCGVWMLLSALKRREY